jgi:DNA-binding IclR family transcriptional regulator
MSHIPAERCLEIIELLAEDAASMPLSEISERLSLPKSGAHRMLATLVDLGWAEQDSETSYYRLTMRLAILGQRFYVATGLPDMCQPVLDKLARACGEFARLAVVDSQGLVWVAQAQGSLGGLLYQPSLNTNIVPLHRTAAGKAWLATLPTDAAMKRVLQFKFDDAGRYGPNAVQNIEAFMRELKATAKRGYGLAVNEAEPGVTAVALPIVPGEGMPAVGTVSIAGPSVRIPDARQLEIAQQVLAAAQELAKLWPTRIQHRSPRADIHSRTTA